MRAFVTGGTGFIGGTVARRLLADGWEVTALVRTPSKAADLERRGATIHQGDVTDTDGLDAAIKGHDAVFHLAAWYALGARDRARMTAINVGGTENILRAAADAGVPKVVYCSSVAALGPNPPGVVGDETKEHDGTYVSIYEETKHAAHLVAQRFARDGLNVSTVLPCAVFGPGDVSLMGNLITWYAKGRLLALPFAGSQISFVHVDDVAGGAVAALEGGAGEDYILGGDNITIGQLFEDAAPVTGIKAPRLKISVEVVERFIPLSPIIAKVMGQEPDFIRDAVRNTTGSLMFSSAKAQREIGYTYRSAIDGLAESVAAIRGR